MSNNKNKKNYKAKKRMSPETKDKLKTGFATIINNDACVKVAREWKGPIQALPICLAVVSVVLAVLPSFISQMNVQGASGVYGSPLDNFDVGLASFTHALTVDEKGNARPEGEIVHVSFTEDGELKLTNVEKLYHTEGEVTYSWFIDVDTATKAPAFEVFFNTFSIDDETFFNRLSKDMNPETGNARHGEDVVTPQASYLALGKTKMVFRKVHSTRGQEGAYDRIKGQDLVDFTPKNANGDLIPYTSYSYRSTIVKNWTPFINATFETAKINSAWSFTGIMAGIDLGLVVLFGLILFVMTRGKKNPFRIINLWETIKMAGMASFTPAILAMIVGFWMPQYAYLFFMFIYGMRMMWMSMKSLRPMQ